MNFQIRPARPQDSEVLIDVWLRSVRATHSFVSDADLQSFMPLVRAYLAAAGGLWIVGGSDGTAVGFMGLAGTEVESLFLAPEVQRQGLGRRLIDHARRDSQELTVSVNEQNTGAVGFYEACGFITVGRSELDDNGRPYPLLKMRLQRQESGER
jgi:putative acetyltransferase